MSIRSYRNSASSLTELRCRGSTMEIPDRVLLEDEPMQGIVERWEHESEALAQLGCRAPDWHVLAARSAATEGGA